MRTCLQYGPVRIPLEDIATESASESARTSAQQQRPDSFGTYGVRGRQNRGNRQNTFWLLVGWDPRLQHRLSVT